MDRNDLSELALGYITDNNVFCELATGTGKSKIAIDCINKMCRPEDDVLIIVPKKTNITGWENECVKWSCKCKPTIVCYNALDEFIMKKNVCNIKRPVTKKPFLALMAKKWKMVVLDEAHHLSESKQTSFNKLSKERIIGLSATIKRDIRRYFMTYYKVKWVKMDMKSAIENKILPDPEIWLVPLHLDDAHINHEVEVNKSASNPVIRDSIRNKWVYKRSGKHAVLVCTAKQKYDDMSGMINWLKTNGKEMLYKHKCGERLKWLAHLKNDLVKRILNGLRNYRYIVMCTDIAQTNYLGTNCVHSKNKDYSKVLENFNTKKIHNLSSCHIIDEGENLVDCKYAVFANINASDRMQVQRVGRALRHPHPIVIIPYYEHTREHEIVNTWMNNYNPNLIKTIKYETLV